MMRTLSTPANGSLADSTLPRLSAVDIPEFLRREGSAPGPAQNLLPEEVKDALFDLKAALSGAQPRNQSLFTIGVKLNPRSDSASARTFTADLLSNIRYLYGVPVADGSEDRQPLQALEVVRDHFSQVAQLFVGEGYRSFSVVAARNSVADGWHRHDFLTYVLYCGRERGTEVLLGSPDRYWVELKSVKDGWSRRSQDVLRFEPAPTEISSTGEGLILPPAVTHRARHPSSPQGQQGVNLALILMAFKE